MPRAVKHATLRRVALFDLIVTLPFALPIVAQRVVYALFDLDEWPSASARPCRASIRSTCSSST